MSDQENFLTRWSRRKLEPAAKDAASVPPPAAGAPQAKDELEKALPPAEAPPEFDVSTLPSLDSIGAGTDIRAFLQAGVPEALRHAALRRAWSADPAIRDYIGPNENFWEGVGPGGVPGFGELDPNLDIKKLVAEVFGEAEREPREPASSVAATGQRADASDLAASSARESAPSERRPSTAHDVDPLLRRDMNVASHHDAHQEAAAAKPRRHGGAMPQ